MIIELKHHVSQSGIAASSIFLHFFTAKIPHDFSIFDRTTRCAIASL